MAALEDRKQTTRGQQGYLLVLPEGAPRANTIFKLTKALFGQNTALRCDKCNSGKDYAIFDDISKQIFNPRTAATAADVKAIWELTKLYKSQTAHDRFLDRHSTP